METPFSQLDHLIVYAKTLQDGVKWCQTTFGVTPNIGGQHKLFGTHNMLLRIDGHAYPNAYLEIIAINPNADSPQRTRWLDMDDPNLKSTVISQPKLTHWVLRTNHIQNIVEKLLNVGIDRGEVIQASRCTPFGLLQWKISVRKDGQRLMNGCMPTIIEWKKVHPCETLPITNIRLKRIVIECNQPSIQLLKKAMSIINLKEQQYQLIQGNTLNISCYFDSPNGIIKI